jgi:hypothetical protein
MENEQKIVKNLCGFFNWNERPTKSSIQNALLLACLKDLELRNVDPLTDITFCKALHVIAYNKKSYTAS